jgi:hypothetical protein
MIGDGAAKQVGPALTPLRRQPGTDVDATILQIPIKLRQHEPDCLVVERVVSEAHNF